MLDDPNSPLAQWIRETFGHKAMAAIVKEINDKLDHTSPILPQVDHGEYTVVGNAFDYLFRWHLGPLTKTVAQGGALILATEGWPNTDDVVQATLDHGSQSTDPAERATCAIVLTWFEAVFRSRAERIVQPLNAIKSQTDPVKAAAYLRQQVNPAVVDDLVNLVTHIPQVWDFTNHEVRYLNPTFAGSIDVGGADADWIFGGTLYECKVTIRERPFRRRDLLQAIGYALLDYDDRYHIRKVGWYFPRQRVRYVYTLADLFRRLAVLQDIAELRKEIGRHLGGWIKPTKA